MPHEAADDQKESEMAACRERSTYDRVTFEEVGGGTRPRLIGAPPTCEPLGRHHTETRTTWIATPGSRPSVALGRCVYTWALGVDSFLPVAAIGASRVPFLTTSAKWNSRESG